jgi:SAM-dependent methyltransferase
MSKRAAWNERYAASELVWGADPNRFVAEALAAVEPRGRALDLACGEGRNAIWLAERGWQTTGVDYSGVALERARRLAERRGAEVRFVEADVTQWEPEPGAYALVLVAYLQLPPDELHAAWRAAVAAMDIGGELFAIGHAKRNLEEGSGGPQDPRVLWEPEGIARELEAMGLEIDQAEHVVRDREGDAIPAIDALIRAHRSSRAGA